MEHLTVRHQGPFRDVAAKWDASEVQKLFTHSASTALNAIAAVRQSFQDDAKQCGAAVVLLLSAAAVHKKSFTAEEARLFVTNVEDFVVPGADYHNQFYDSEFMMSLLRDVVEAYVDITNTPLQYRRCITTLRAIASAFSPGAQFLTPSHSFLMRVAIDNDHPAIALDIFATNVFLEIQPSATGCTLKDFIQFYYLGGLVHCAYHDYPRALCAFESCLLLPYRGSEISVAAAKCYLLTSLIVHGKVSRTSSASSTGVLQGYSVLCKTYFDFADVFRSLDVKAFHQGLSIAAPIFYADGTGHLFDRAVHSFSCFIIRKLSSVYSSTTLGRIAARCGFEEDTERAKCLLLDMIENGELNATIAGNGDVVFLPRPAIDAAQLQSSIRDAVRVQQLVEESDREVQKSTTYVSTKFAASNEFAEAVEQYEKQRLASKASIGRLSAMLK